MEVRDSSTLLFLLPLPPPPHLPSLAVSPRAVAQEPQALPCLASGPRNASSTIRAHGTTGGCSPAPSTALGWEEVSSPQEAAGAGPWPASGCQQGRGGSSGWGGVDKGFKVLLGEAPELQAHHLPACGHHVVRGSVPCPVPGGGW